MSVMSDSVRPHRQQPTRLLHPWDSPGKNTGVGFHFLLQCMKVKKKDHILNILGLDTTYLSVTFVCFSTPFTNVKIVVSLLAIKSARSWGYSLPALDRYLCPLFKKKIFLIDWRIIVLQCCVGFCHTTVLISPECRYVPSLLRLPPTPCPIPPLQAVTERQTELPVSCSNCPLAICFAYGNGYFPALPLSIRPTLSFPCCVQKPVLHVCVSVPALQIDSSLPFF